VDNPCVLRAKIGIPTDSGRRVGRDRKPVSINRSSVRPSLKESRTGPRWSRLALPPYQARRRRRGCLPHTENHADDEEIEQTLQSLHTYDHPSRRDDSSSRALRPLTKCEALLKPSAVDRFPHP